MSLELTLSGSLAYSDANLVSDELAIASLIQSVSGHIISRNVKDIATSETAIPLGAVGTLGYAILVNRSTVNYVDVKTGASGIIFARLRPNGGFCILEFGSGITAPVAIANTASCLVESLICQQ